MCNRNWAERAVSMWNMSVTCPGGTLADDAAIQANLTKISPTAADHGTLGVLIDIANWIDEVRASCFGG